LLRSLLVLHKNQISAGHPSVGQRHSKPPYSTAGHPTGCSVSLDPHPYTYLYAEQRKCKSPPCKDAKTQLLMLVCRPSCGVRSHEGVNLHEFSTHNNKKNNVPQRCVDRSATPGRAAPNTKKLAFQHALLAHTPPNSLLRPTINGVLATPIPLN